MINLDDKQGKGTHCVSLFINKNTAVCFDSFGIEYIPQRLLNKIKDKFITHNIFRIQDDDYYEWILLHRFYKINDCRKKFDRFYQLLFF